jgi:hypothetical protein
MWRRVVRANGTGQKESVPFARFLLPLYVRQQGCAFSVTLIIIFVQVSVQLLTQQCILFINYLIVVIIS